MLFAPVRRQSISPSRTPTDSPVTVVLLFPSRPGCVKVGETWMLVEVIPQRSIEHWPARAERNHLELIKNIEWVDCVLGAVLDGVRQFWGCRPVCCLLRQHSSGQYSCEKHRHHGGREQITIPFTRRPCVSWSCPTTASIVWWQSPRSDRVEWTLMFWDPWCKLGIPGGTIGVLCFLSVPASHRAVDHVSWTRLCCLWEKPGFFSRDPLPEACAPGKHPHVVHSMRLAQLAFPQTKRAGTCPSGAALDRRGPWGLGRTAQWPLPGESAWCPLHHSLDWHPL